MVLHELVVSLLASYASSEYLHGSRRRAAFAIGAALAANGLLLLPTVMPALGLRSKVPVVAVCYIGTLYTDVVFFRRQLDWLQFCEALQEAVGRLMFPLFPLLSLLFAFIFLEIGELCERSGLPTLWLNDPIYYGVLYGPFAYLYVHVKAVAKAQTVLPVAARSRCKD